LTGLFFASLLLPAFSGGQLFAQTTTPPATSSSAPAADNAQHLADMEKRLNEVTDALTQTQQTLQQSLLEIQRLRAQLDALRAEQAKLHGTAPEGTVAGSVPGNIPGGIEKTPESVVATGQPQPAVSSGSTSEDIDALREQVGMLQAEVKQHDQIKVETASKYRLRVTGLALFNAFSNAGVVDNVELPTLAMPRIAGDSHGSLGGTVRQSLIGVEATGPTINGAHSYAALSIDFFGGSSSNTYGYNSTSGVVRLRYAQMGLDWDKTTVQVGYTEPLISPLSPTSYATVAQPALSGSGNLWEWSPQLRVEQRVPISGQRGFALEAGLISPQSIGYTATQLDSPVEASRRPGVEGRVSYRSNLGASDRPFAIGVGTYTASQFYDGDIHVHAWAVTGDWQIPLYKWFDLTGEVYRGRALGGLGGGGYKDMLSGTDPVTGLPKSEGVETAGGWSQLKIHFLPTLEANAAYGLDDTFTSNFDNLILMTPTNAQVGARNSSVIGNLVFRPKSSLIFSPEYRRIQSWQYTGPANIANIFTLSVGYQF
jgi:polyhydroxyalkanoate synthesis regulator phasin